MMVWIQVVKEVGAGGVSKTTAVFLARKLRAGSSTEQWELDRPGRGIPESRIGHTELRSL